MRSLFLSAAAAAIGFFSGIAPSTAAEPQPAPMTGRSYEQVKQLCRQQGDDQALSGDALSRFVEQCLAQASTATEVAAPIPTWEQKQAMCLQEGQTQKGLTGSALTQFVDLCLGSAVGSGTSTPPATTGDPYAAKLEVCREEGQTRRGLTGDMLREFVTRCVSNQ
jgi:hypothetical protein